MATYLKVNGPSADGSLFGTSSSELIGFHGATPSDQAALLADVVSTWTAATTTEYALTSTQGAAYATAINGIIDVLVEKGLMASA